MPVIQSRRGVAIHCNTDLINPAREPLCIRTIQTVLLLYCIRVPESCSNHKSICSKGCNNIPPGFKRPDQEITSSGMLFLQLRLKIQSYTVPRNIQVNQILWHTVQAIAARFTATCFTARAARSEFVCGLSDRHLQISVVKGRGLVPESGRTLT